MAKSFCKFTYFFRTDQIFMSKKCFYALMDGGTGKWTQTDTCGHKRT